MKPTLWGLLIGAIASAAILVYYSPAAITSRARSRGYHVFYGKDMK